MRMLRLMGPEGRIVLRNGRVIPTLTDVRHRERSIRGVFG
jgi:hypothetical protein